MDGLVKEGHQVDCSIIKVDDNEGLLFVRTPRKYLNSEYNKDQQEG